MLIRLFSLVLLLCSIQASANELQSIMKKRNLSEKDIIAAAKTYQPSGRKDKYIVFDSGGQSGQVLVIGVPSMRILKVIGVFTPEPWQGYGFDDGSKAILAEGDVDGKKLTWGDSHHPALSESNGEYDGKYLFINDKANARIAVISLRDFETKQIVVNPILKSNHGGTFVTPNTEYIVEASQYATPLKNDHYVPLSQFREQYRGGVTFWKFDKKKGRVDKKQSFTLELPPYDQDLSDMGKGISYGWGFTNSFNTEMYTGGIGIGRAPNEAGMSRNDTDFMHVYNWKLLAKLAKNPKNVKIINGAKVIPMSVAIKHHALFLIPEPKSPHGVNVDKTGRYIIVAGKLDTHASVFDFTKIKKLIDHKEYAGKDSFGIPILSMKKSLHGQLQLGLGPLHTVFSNKKGIVYTSLFIDSAIVKWDYINLKVLDKIAVNYNIGHLVAMEGDSTDPQGEYIISLNKLALDRFNEVGPLHPQNHQLIDIRGKKMQLLYDLPIPLGEPHNAVSIRSSKLHPIPRYKVGTNSRKERMSHGRTLAGQERIVRHGKHVTVYGTVVRSHINPERINVNLGDDVTIYLTSLERAEDETHGFAIDRYNIQASIEPGKTVRVSFKADREGVYPYYCTEFCSALHLEMMGYLLVKDPHKHYKTIVGKKVTASTATLLKEYRKAVKGNKATDAIIQSVVKFLSDNNYKKYSEVTSLVNDALAQYKKIPAIKKKADDAFNAKHYNKAVLLQGYVWQYLVKTATPGLRAKELLVDKLATKKSPSASAGEQDYAKFGCNGCHIIGRVSSGPNLLGVLNRHKNGKVWVKKYIMNPQKYYKQPYIGALVHSFNLKMPNQGVDSKSADDIISYFKWLDDNAKLYQ